MGACMECKEPTGEPHLEPAKLQGQIDAKHYVADQPVNFERST